MRTVESIAVGVTAGICGIVILGYLGFFDYLMVDDVVGCLTLFCLPRK